MLQIVFAEIFNIRHNNGQVEKRSLFVIYILLYTASKRALCCLILVSWENLYKLGWVWRIWKILKLNMIQSRQYSDAVPFISALALFEEYWWGYGVECSQLGNSFHRLFILYALSVISSSEKTLQNKIWWLMPLKMFLINLFLYMLYIWSTLSLPR